MDKSNKNFVVGDISLGQGREEATIYPQGCKEGRNPVMMKDMKSSSYGEEEHKVGDHAEME